MNRRERALLGTRRHFLSQGPAGAALALVGGCAQKRMRQPTPVSAETAKKPETAGEFPVSALWLDDLRCRLDRFQWVSSAAPTQGISRARLEGLLMHWRVGFDWRSVEKRMQGLGVRTLARPQSPEIQLLHQRATKGNSPRLPILLLHGWPDSSLLFHRLIPLLTKSGHDVVAPSLPGFGWSAEDPSETSTLGMAKTIHEIMNELGYSRYVVHGTDFGALVACDLAARFADRVRGLHLTQVPFDRLFMVDRASLTPEEQSFFESLDGWVRGASYLGIHQTQADTLAAALQDSPLGLLAWVAEKYDAWSELPISDNDILASVSTMWLARSVRSSLRLYSEPAGVWGKEPASVTAKTAFALAPKDTLPPAPRSLAERLFPVARHKTLPRGGHWPALEVPDTLAADLVEFVAECET